MTDWPKNLAESIRLASALAYGHLWTLERCRCHWGLGECRHCSTLRRGPVTS